MERVDPRAKRLELARHSAVFEGDGCARHDLLAAAGDGLRVGSGDSERG